MSIQRVVHNRANNNENWDHREKYIYIIFIPQSTIFASVVPNAQQQFNDCSRFLPMFTHTTQTRALRQNDFYWKKPYFVFINNTIKNKVAINIIIDAHRKQRRLWKRICSVLCHSYWKRSTNERRRWRSAQIIYKIVHIICYNVIMYEWLYSIYICISYGVWMGREGSDIRRCLVNKMKVIS